MNEVIRPRLIVVAGPNGAGKTSITEQFKVSRNDPCPCSSGKKYKKCCLAKE